MITKILSVTKYIIVIIVFLISFMACEKDFKDIGIDLVDNNKFETNILISDIIAFNKNIDSVRVDSLPQYVLGVNLNNTLGKTTASIVTQIDLAPGGIDFGDNPTIDSVILDIPYYSTPTGTIEVKDPRSENDSIAVPVFELDSIVGNENRSFIVTVSELGTFLNDLNPLDPTKRNFYYSNKNYNIKEPPLFSGKFIPNANDTVAFIKHKDLKGNIFEIDSVKRVGSIPSMKFPLDEDLIQKIFVDQDDRSVFSTFEDFTHFFRGLLITAEGSDGSLITVPLTNGSITIFYSNDQNFTDIDDASTISRVSHSMIFPLSGINANNFGHDYSLATSSIQTRLLNPDKINGEQKLYIQGASGSMVVLNLFTKDNLEEIRSKNWLINEANIKLYVDRNETAGTLPERLFIFNIDNGSHLSDIFSEGLFALDGTLHFNDNGDPDFYIFKITDHISKVLSKDSSIKSSKLGIRVFSPFDIPSFVRLSDTIIKSFNWNPKGVAVFGNKELGDKKLTLEIFYTEPKNK